MLDLLRKIFNFDDTKEQGIDRNVEIPLYNKNEGTDQEEKLTSEKEHVGCAKLIFHFDNKLKVKVRSEIPQEMKEVFINEKIVNSGEEDDEQVLHYAMVLLALEVSEQILGTMNEPRN